MDEAALEAFEARAAAAERRLAALELKLLHDRQQPPTAEPTNVTELDEARLALANAKVEQESIRSDLDEVSEKNSVLEAENAKLKYQIFHLKKALREAETSASSA
uniref:Uncharacterized protein n=1 Tax=Tetraselmis sp. GSL018 TaxID=582737 RepID=A0A061RCD6_9CHLO|mmetsp:Transcript_33869/g.80398  ORF Transcript_33869/g.80398 Transcript_33869/m.80398 type:complete len:105 (-) Transcript_33869:228-542(-)|eukprot:CAMPEP_0177587994 /NCGR_PEP_ID=MMETSP0419_2-20121207/5974_1 /TAXON_ID=582737 /ORGANISM="Tetraselmis sp., Strain GSL018" /LENGTH=104 /DNA_ID=CAMNT_0019078133 /DNA_START=48 /DNA_END=362 /DNA_ORIENTATION=+